MKRHYIYTALIGAATLFTSCDDYLDKMPDNRTEIDNEEKITKLLVSAYPFYSYVYLAEMMSDNTDDNGSKYSPYCRLDEDTYNWKDTKETGDDCPDNLWNSCYTMTATANQALQAIDKLGNPSSLSAQRGEALLCRAYGHWLLTYMFCLPYSESNATTALGVPYSTTPETTVCPHYERGTLGETYDMIAKDIEEGLPLISNSIYSVPSYHFNRKAAYAFASRFYLYYGKLDKAIACANEVLGADPSSLMRDWASLAELSRNGNIQPDAYVNANNKANLLIVSCYSFWGITHGPYAANSKYTHNYTIANDETTQSEDVWGNCMDVLKHKAASYSMPKVVTRKLGAYLEYIDAAGTQGYYHTCEVPFTTDGTLLDRAEAYALSNDLTHAIADLQTWVNAYTTSTITLNVDTINNYYNKIAYYTPTAPTIKKEMHPVMPVTLGGSQENVLHAILHARRILTVHEGNRWGDIKRYGFTIYRRTVVNKNITVTDSMTANDPRRALQIPDKVITAGMQANPRTESNQ